MSFLLQFRAASQHIRLGNIHPNDNIRWKLYALAKQATTGDNKTGAPPSTGPVARAKWEAWNDCRGMDVEKAMQAYIAEVEKLDPKFIAANVKESEIKSTMATSVIMEGTLFKQRDVFLGWRPRHFVLQDTFLHYFLDGSDTVPRNTMDLIGATITPVKQTKVGSKEVFPFVISHSKSTICYNLAAETKTESEEWIKAIRSCAAKPISSQTTPATIPTNERIIPRRPLPLDDEEKEEREKKNLVATVHQQESTKNVPPKYAPKIEKAVEAMMELSDPDCAGWEPLFESNGVKATKRPGSVLCVRGEGVVAFPILEVFRLVLNGSRMTELDPQLYTNKKLKQLSINSSIEYMRWKQVWPTAPRDMCNISHWRLMADGAIVIVSFSEKFDDLCPLTDGGVVRAECILGGYVFRQVPGGTMVRYLVQVSGESSLDPRL